MKKEIIAHVLRLLTVGLMLVVVAINRDGRLWGNQLSDTMTKADTATLQTTQSRDDSLIVVNTKEIASDVYGFSGPTPLTITFKEGRVVAVKAETNSETADFFNRAFEHYQKEWIGKSADEIMTGRVNAVTGATMSSNALNLNMRRAIMQLPPATEATHGNDEAAGWTLVKMAVLLVVTLGCILPFFGRFRRYRTLWLCVNVCVLGLWGGTFLSYSLFVSWIGNGVNLMASLAVLLMLIAAFIYPVFGKKSHYCTWICPMGAVQDLAGTVNKNHKLNISPKATKALTLFNLLLWAALMLLMLLGVWFEWMDYEVFSAFLFTTASPIVIAFALMFIVLSAFITRPYCRFVCPTGCLFRLTQNTK